MYRNIVVYKLDLVIVVNDVVIDTVVDQVEIINEIIGKTGPGSIREFVI